MKSVILYSGGKDSTMALYHAQQNGDEIYALLTMVSRNDQSYMFHVPAIDMVDYTAAAMELPVIEVATDGVKEEELDDLEKTLTRLKDKGVECVYSGAIESVYQKSRIDNICEKLGLKSVAPLWHQDPLEYMNEIIDLGFDVILTAVAAYGLDEKWLGRKITKQALDELVELNKKYGIHIAFEGGEAETLVLDGPMYDRRVVIDDAQKEFEYDSGLYLIKDVHLEEKYDYSLDEEGEDN